MSTRSSTFLTPEQYLEIERKAEYKSEYFGGEMFAMAGASREHCLLSANLLAILHLQLRTRSCEIYTSDMRVRVTRTGLFTYPDVTVVCGEPRFTDDVVDTLSIPHSWLKCCHPARKLTTAAASLSTTAPSNRSANTCWLPRIGCMPTYTHASRMEAGC